MHSTVRVQSRLNTSIKPWDYNISRMKYSASEFNRHEQSLLCRLVQQYWRTYEFDEVLVLRFAIMLGRVVIMTY